MNTRLELELIIDTITNRTVYAWYSAIDCDMMQVAYAIKYRNRRAFDKAMNCIYDDAEGPVSLTRMTKEEYLQNIDHPVRRDIAAEQMGY